MPSPRTMMHLPHLPSFSRQPLLFITTCTSERKSLLADASAQKILLETWRRSTELDGWFVGRYVIMPDHVHLFAKHALEAKSLPEWMKTWKSITARRFLALGMGVAPVWQPDYFDRFVRTSAAYEQKWDYLLQNPVRRGLCTRQEDWPFRGVLHDLAF